MLVFWRVNKVTSKPPALLSFGIYQLNSEVIRHFYFFKNLCLFFRWFCSDSAMGLITTKNRQLVGISLIFSNHQRVANQRYGKPTRQVNSNFHSINATPDGWWHWFSCSVSLVFLGVSQSYWSYSVVDVQNLHYSFCSNIFCCKHWSDLLPKSAWGTLLRDYEHHWFPLTRPY